jgi:hypothetical protein
MEGIMRSLRRRFELLCFGLYVAVVAVGTSVDVVGRVLGH